MIHFGAEDGRKRVITLDAHGAGIMTITEAHADGANPSLWQQGGVFTKQP